jgi:acetyl-CoA synthetase
MASDARARFDWEPSAALRESCELAAFMRRHGIASLPELMLRSTRDVEWFWGAVLEELGVVWHHRPTRVLDVSGGIERPTWCPSGRMNIVGTLLDRHAGTPQDSHVAISHESESGAVGTWTYGRLREESARVAGALRRLGVKPGEVIGVFMPLSPECVAAMLGIIRMGGIFLPLFSGYGAAAVATRLADAGAVALITVDGFRRRGKAVEVKSIADEAATRVPSLKRMLVHAQLGEPVKLTTGRDLLWSDAVDSPDALAAGQTVEVRSAEDCCMLIYTSGTTGKPKGAVHTHCGFPIKSAQDMLHGFDVRADEVIYWITDMGWMMGPWLVFGTLLCKATMVLYDGALDFPSNDRLWAVAAQHRVTALGVSPTLIRSMLRHGREHVERHDLSPLRKFGSTGEPWNDEPWRWLFEVVGRRQLPIWNYSGGTEISGGIVGGNMLSPLRPGAFAGPLPGMAADVVDDHGQSVRGEVGELVIRAPWIGMTRGFWNDAPDAHGNTRYHAAYWSRFPGVWHHGDFASVDSDGLWYIHGRSDDTIKVAGKRVGPAEVESALVAHPAVLEAAAIGVPDELKGQALVCFVTLRHGHHASPELSHALRQAVAAAEGKPLTPKAVHVLSQLPRTRNGKILRRAIRSAYLGEPAGDLSSLENPPALEEVTALGRTVVH